VNRQNTERRVGDLVRRHAVRYEPDSDRIRSRMDRHETAPVAPEPRPVLRRIGPPLASAVAVAVAVIVAVVGVRAAGGPNGLRVLAAESSTAAAATVPSGRPGGGTATIGPNPSPPSLPSIRPPAPLPATGPPAPPGPSAAGSTPSPRPTAAPPTGAPGLAVQALSSGHPLVLGADDGLDWVLPGVRRDGTVVRRKNPTTALAGPVVRLGRSGATGVPGPYLVSWSGGAPEQDHDAAVGWLSLDPDGGAVHVEAGGGRRLTLYVGTAGADCVVRAAVGGSTTSVTVRAGTPAAVVTVSAGTATGPLVVELTGVSRSAGGRVGLAAVLLR